MYFFTGSMKAAIICLAGFFFCFLVYFPGFLSPDSIDQYGQALHNTYYDWHPPVMAYLWHWLNYISKGPQVMLAFQLSMLWSSCFLLITGMGNNRAGTAALLLCLAAPFVQNFAGYIVKDTQMAFTLLLVFAFIFNWSETRKYKGRGYTILVFLLLCYGSWLRINALPAVVPLIVYALATYNVPRRKTALAAAGIIVFMLIGQWFFTGYVIRAGKDHPENKLLLHDLTSIYVATGENVYPAFLYRQPGFDTAYLRTHYEPATFDEILEKNAGIATVTDESQDSSRALKWSWVAALRKHPLIYLRHRSTGFLYYLRILNSNRPCCAVYLHTDTNPFGIVYRSGTFSAFVVWLITAQEDMFYMRPWFWLALSLLLLIVVWRRKDADYRLPTLVLLASGILYQLPYFFIAPIDTDFRYCYWTVIACSIAVVLQIAGYSLRNKKPV